MQLARVNALILNNTQQRRTYMAPSVTFISLPQRTPQTPRPQFFSGKVPAYAPSARQRGQQSPMDAMLPQTPMPTAGAFTEAVQESRVEYGVGEMLMGCGVLMVIGILVLVVLYYISM